MLETVNADADRVTRLITELLDVSRIESGRIEVHRELVDIPEQARKVIAGRVAAGDAEDRFRLEVSLGAAGDLAGRRQDLPDPGQPHRERGPARGWYGNHHGASRPGREDAPGVAVSVRDQGQGIAPELAPRVFRQFWRVKRRGGAGLGLFIVKGLVEAHGGTIAVHQAPGGGAEFRFTDARRHARLRLTGGPAAATRGAAPASHLCDSSRQSAAMRPRDPRPDCTFRQRIGDRRRAARPCPHRIRAMTPCRWPTLSPERGAAHARRGAGRHRRRRGPGRAEGGPAGPRGRPGADHAGQRRDRGAAAGRPGRGGQAGRRGPRRDPGRARRPAGRAGDRSATHGCWSRRPPTSRSRGTGSPPAPGTR